jgi:hypothetical protein
MDVDAALEDAVEVAPQRPHEAPTTSQRSARPSQVREALSNRKSRCTGRKNKRLSRTQMKTLPIAMLELVAYICPTATVD